ncbi:MAG: hypothetical protein WA130_15890, partial [Candidatus Methanoperedens sp.]
AEAIETKLNSFSDKGKVEVTVGGSGFKYGVDDGGTDGLKGKARIRQPDFVDISDISKIGEYKDWEIQNMGFTFSNVRVFPQLQNKLSLILLGISDVKHSVNISSEKMSLTINETEISDLNSLMEILFKISNMFADNLKAHLELSFGSELKIDDDLVDNFGQLKALGDVLVFNSKLKK